MVSLNKAQRVSAEEAISYIPKKARVFVHGGAATPNILIAEILATHDKYEELNFTHLHTHGIADYAFPDYKDKFKVTNLFVGQNIRPYIDFDRVDYLPCFLSEIPQLFRQKKLILDVALVQVSPPDQHGYCSLGTSVDVTKAAVESAKLVIAHVNPAMPRTHGDGLIHQSAIDYMVEHHAPIYQSQPKPLTSEELKIGEFTASLIEDGATLQTGIGSIPDAVLSCLKNHKNLGIHTEMWSDGALELIQCGAVTNSEKKFHRGKTVSTFLIGSQNLYNFVNDNPSVILLEANYVNNPSIIARNDKVTAINSAVEVDLTGQVCADSIGHKIISGVGGQIDFIRGATLSKGGKPIIAISSRSKKGIPRIVPTLKAGAGVVTTRAHIHYVVTEYGIADLYGKTLKQRAQALIQIAHPEDREKLEADFYQEYRSKTGN